MGRGVAGAFIVVAHSPEFEPDDLDLELGYALEAEPARVPVASAGHKLALRTLEAQARVATCMRVGSPAQAHLTTGRIGHQLEAGGYRLCGPNREIFLQQPRNAEPESSVIESVFPIEPACRG